MDKSEYLRENYPHIETEEQVQALDEATNILAEAFIAVAVALSDDFRKNGMSLEDTSLAVAHASILTAGGIIRALAEARPDSEVSLTLLHECAEFFNTALVQTATELRGKNQCPN